MKNEFLETGVILNTHGIKGEVKVQPWADSPQDFCRFTTLYVDGKAMAVAAARPDKTMALVKLEGVDTVEKAMKLKGKVVSVRRDQVHLPAGAFLLADLVGLAVVDDATGVEIGRIAEVLTPPAHNVYVVTGGAHSYMIPAVPAFIVRTDIDGGCVRVNLIEGLETDVSN